MTVAAPLRTTRVAPEPPRSTTPAAAPAQLRLVSRNAPVAKGTRAPKTPFVILLLSLLGAGLLGLLLLNTVIDQDAFTLHDLQGKQTSLDVAEAQLRETANGNADPAALAARAAALGMVPAGAPTFRKLARLPKGGTRVGNLYIVPAKPAAAPVTAATPVTAAAPVTTGATAVATPATVAKASPANPANPAVGVRATSARATPAKRPTPTPTPAPAPARASRTSRRAEPAASGSVSQKRGRIPSVTRLASARPVAHP